LNILRNKIHILFVVDGIEFGGGERVFLQLASRLGTFYKIHFAASPGGVFEQKVKEHNVDFFPVDMGRQISVKPIWQLKDIVASKDIHLIHSQGARANFFARVAGRLAGVPHNVCTVATLIENFYVSPARKRIYRMIDNLFQRYVDTFIVVSDALQETLLQNYSIASNRTCRIYNGIDLKKFSPDTYNRNLRKEWKISEAVPLIGSIGRLVWEKGFEFLINAAPGVLRAVPDAKFLIVGEGPLKEQLIVKSEQLNVRDRIVFAGFRNDIKEIIAALDLLVIPSLSEGFPMVILEAMAMEKPIIASCINGIIEQITDGENGVLVSPKDHNALTKSILKLIQDKELSKKLGIAARKKVEQEFSVEKMVAETEKVYLSIVQDRCIEPLD